MRRFTNYETLLEIIPLSVLFMVSFMVGGPLRLGPYLKVECMNQKTKLSIESHLIGDQNDIGIVGM